MRKGIFRNTRYHLMLYGLAATFFPVAGNAIGVGGWLNDPLKTHQEIRSVPAGACDAPLPQDKPLALADVVHYALCNNPDTRISWAEVLGNAAKLGSSRATYLPSVDVSASLARSDTTGTAAVNTVTPAVSLSYLLFDFGGREATVESTKQGLIASDYAHSATLQSVLFSVIQAYYQLYSSTAAVDAAKETVKSGKASLDAAAARYKVGVSTIADKLQAETAYAQALLKETQAENEMQVDRGILANVMGLSPEAAFAISTNAPEELDAEFSGDITAMLEQARQSRPDLVASEAQIKSAMAGLRVQQADGLPNLSVSASADRRDEIEGGTGHNDATIGLRLHVPLFTGFDRSYKIDAARAALESRIAKHEQARNAALLDVWRSWSNFQTAKQTRSMTDTLLASAQKSEQVALGRYKAGAGSITDLLNAESQLADARQQHVASQYDWLVAKADLLRALGGLDSKAVAAAP